MSELLHEYVEILTDPAHALAELTFVAIDAVLLTPVVLWARRMVRREHAAIDAEHGVVHRRPAGGRLTEGELADLLTRDGWVEVVPPFATDPLEVGE